MKIEIAIQAYNFDKRLCWMLSSILQQVERKKGRGLPDISVKVAHLSGTGTQALCNFFYKKGLSVLTRGYPGISRFQSRGLVRNDDLKETCADWVLFADSDMVYPPKFFAVLGKLLRTKYKNNTKCLFSQRQSTYLEPTVKLIDTYEYPSVIPDAWGQANKLDAILKRNVGAGYCQIINVKSLKERIYVSESSPRDMVWSKGQKARSDMHFRKRVGREAILLPIQVHLQHERLKPEERDC